MKAGEKDCIFCKIAQGKIKRKRILETNNFFVMRDDNQDIKGSTLVIPKKHFVTLLDIPDKLGEELLKLVKNVSSDLMDKKLGDGFNILMNNLGVAGQIVMHAHIHVIPRREGDGVGVLG